MERRTCSPHAKRLDVVNRRSWRQAAPRQYRPAGWIAIPIAWQILTSLQVAANSNEDVKAVVGLIGLAIGLWVLIDLGLLKGTPGPNRYGPDPLAAKVQAAS